MTHPSLVQSMIAVQHPVKTCRPSLPLSAFHSGPLAALIAGLITAVACIVPANASAATCAPVTSGYAVDSAVTYFVKDNENPGKSMEKRVAGADPGSFELLRLPLFERGPCAGRRVEFARDKRHVYYRWQIIKGADPQTYAFIDDAYARDKSAIFSGAKRLTTRIDSFKTMGAYATDGTQHFYRDVVFAGASFRLLGGEAESARGYAVTTSRVYHNGQVVTHADASSFELFKPEVGITRDKRFVFFNDVAVPGADPTSFQQVNGYTFKDKTGVYTEGKRIAGAEAASIRATEFGSYLIDSANVFRFGVPLAKRDPATFVELQPQWSKDKRGVYYKDEAVPQIDAASFKATSLDRGEDRNYRYEGLRAICKFRNEDLLSLPPCQ